MRNGLVADSDLPAAYQPIHPFHPSINQVKNFADPDLRLARSLFPGYVQTQPESYQAGVASASFY
jgi:hypothetical protein